MGAALAVRRRDEAVHETQAAPRVRSALGPSERATTRGASVLRRLLAMRRGDVTLPERRSLVAGVLTEELVSLGTAGASAIPHIVEAIEHGHPVEAAAHLVEAGLTVHHAMELIEAATGHLAGELSEKGPAVAIGLLHAKLAAAVLRRAHDAGESDAMVINYAQTFAATVVDALHGEGVVRPEHTGLAELDGARAEAYSHAMALLRDLDAQTAGEMATSLKQELGTASNARHAIVEMILAQHGKQGIVLHKGGAVR